MGKCLLRVYAVRSTMATLSAHVGAKPDALSRGSGTTRLATITPEHTAQREAAIAASRSFVAVGRQHLSDRMS
jgi:hypothetical protein